MWRWTVEEQEAYLLAIGSMLLSCDVHFALNMSAGAQNKNSGIWKEEQGGLEMRRRLKRENRVLILLRMLEIIDVDFEEK